MSASSSSNEAISCAAFDAMGKIATDDVRAFLKKQMQHGRRRLNAAEAWLGCSWVQLGQGKGAELVEDYQWLVNSRMPIYIRIAAMNGLVRSDPAASADTMCALLKSSKPEIRSAAARAMRTVPDETAKILTGRLNDLPADVLCILLPMLVDGAGEATLKTFMRAMHHENEGVRVQAAQALGRLESADAVQSLLPALCAPGRVGRAAYGSLCRIGGPDVGIAIRSAAGNASPSVRGRLIDILRERGDRRALPLIMAAVRDPNPGLSKSACRALAALAGERQLKGMIELLVNARRSSTRDELGKAVGTVVGRSADKEYCTRLLHGGLKQTRSRNCSALIPIFGKLGTKDALSTVRRYLVSRDVSFRKSAVQALADWPNDSPLPDLLNVAKTERDLKVQVMAIRGYVRMLDCSSRNTDEKLSMSRALLPNARRDCEKELIKGIIAKYEKEAKRK